MKENTEGKTNAQGVAYGEIIRDYRRKKGLSQEQLGEVANVKKNAVSAWEAGRSRPDVATIPALCRMLEMPMNVFFGLEEEERSKAFLDKFDRLSPRNQEIILQRMDEMLRAQVKASPVTGD